MVRAPRSHRGGRRFKSSIAHHVGWGYHEPGLGPHSPGRGGGTADALRSGRSILTDVWVQIPPSAPTPAVLAQRHPSCACSSVDRALPCGGRGREFESRQAHHFFALFPLVSNGLPLIRRGRRNSPPPQPFLSGRGNLHREFPSTPSLSRERVSLSPPWVA